MHFHGFSGLSDKTWTCGLYHPKVARYQLRHTQILTIYGTVRLATFDLMLAFFAQSLYIISLRLGKVKPFFEKNEKK